MVPSAVEIVEHVALNVKTWVAVTRENVTRPSVMPKCPEGVAHYGAVFACDDDVHGPNITLIIPAARMASEHGPHAYV